KLDQPELEKFEEELQNLGKQEQEDVMEIITSWMEEGIQKGLEQGIKQGIEQGIEKGIEQGIEQGRREGKEALLIRQLTRRFGKLESPVVREVKSLSADKIERLAEDLLDFERLLDLECWLAKVQ
ncbi:MAG: DUF4351 domain-containing protein, partial [Cyanobacteria bacterium]|nr:DUF4351 domain-containing protein [Cyanobacteriota bacterium]